METTELDDGAPEVQAWLDERRRLTQILEQAAMDLFAHMGCQHALLELTPGVTLLVRIERAHEPTAECKHDWNEPTLNGDPIQCRKSHRLLAHTL